MNSKGKKLIEEYQFFFMNHNAITLGVVAPILIAIGLLLKWSTSRSEKKDFIYRPLIAGGQKVRKEFSPNEFQEWIRYKYLVAKIFTYMGVFFIIIFLIFFFLDIFNIYT